MNNETKSISSNGEEEVLKQENVTEIYDGKNESILSPNDFQEYCLRTYEKAIDYYLNNEENNIVNNINDGKYLKNSNFQF